MSTTEPEIGKRYRVTVDDCCVEVNFEARLVGITRDDYNRIHTWDNGVTNRVERSSCLKCEELA